MAPAAPAALSTGCLMMADDTAAVPRLGALSFFYKPLAPPERCTVHVQVSDTTLNLYGVAGHNRNLLNVGSDQLHTRVGQQLKVFLVPAEACNRSCGRREDESASLIPPAIETRDAGVHRGEISCHSAMIQRDRIGRSAQVIHHNFLNHCNDI